MKKLIVVIACFCVTSIYAQEQDSTAQRAKWTNLIQIGQVFENDEGVTGRITASITSGIQYRKLSTGIELGFHDYGFFNVGSAALYGKYRVFDNKVSPYSYGLVGYGQPLYYKENTQIDASTNTDGGILYGAGVGVDYLLGKVTLLFQLGYKFQRTTYNQPDYYYWLSSFAPRNSGDQIQVIRKMNRVEFKIGVQF